MSGHALPSIAHQFQLPQGLSNQSSIAVLTLWCQRCSLECTALPSSLHHRVKAVWRHLEALLKLIHSLPAPAKAAKHPAGHLLCLGIPQDSPTRCLHLQSALKFPKCCLCTAAHKPHDHCAADTWGVLHTFIAEIQIRSDMRELRQAFMRCHLSRHAAAKCARLSKLPGKKSMCPGTMHKRGIDT